jgi:hypothetical protein
MDTSVNSKPIRNQICLGVKGLTPCCRQLGMDALVAAFNKKDNSVKLRKKYPWPDSPPDVPEDWMGWLCPDTATALKSRIGPDTQLIVECGTWLGCSARAMLEAAPNALLVCIDTWLGSPEHKSDNAPEEWSRRLPTLYESCQRNLCPWRDRVVMVRQDSLVGLGEVYAAGLKPDLIYLDSKHTTCRVAAELAVCLELFPKAKVVLDDYNNAAVFVAVLNHANATGREIIAIQTTDAPPAACAFDPWRNG